MIGKSRSRVQTTKGRLESGFQILGMILLRRRLEDCPTLGLDMERAILDRELRELEEDLRLNSPFQSGESLRVPHNTRPDGNQGKDYRS